MCSLTIRMKLMAQDTTRIVKKVEQLQKYSSENIICFVESYQTKIEILGLFKPNDIVMNRDLNAEVPHDQMVMRIKVKDQNHAVLRYFKHKAELFHEGKYYDHNVLPDINASRVHSVEFEASNYTKSGYVLKVNVFGEEYKPDRNVTFSTEKRSPKYVDFDGKLMTMEAFKQMNPKMGSFKTETVLYGKMASDKYGDTKYAEGVMVASSIK